ncbi:hypothetical protein GLOIN_2v1478829 [Rhizophagus irregularis DAOM 181602=DAOM 197198]|uniref:Uncharacterized protein n=1 Tax=Rhizophagus irregularis (strain DAOM 181602 / DAOM 197198 / MUCL 43194) TaxID=747089 RepID=A0A2P4PZV4_RHIID|nr:hypothetical protein GLOIN_2v1478829 [Rhizophagus irregularis DAOM 181602=DAOM 197198]POG70898.1 hypothetical protein GLOIN_2v1478829 [Rhizophagus irregularis DAOM 181602=DAOM 197198]GBC22860.2 hypothetical protein GLOIN_2v1478829 [Rhizophagus irregularis DAOM 181602=DAOM 197198]|eukprot:XP_025177764.1 hypothetical protein GLOIN_2v1478829 [Rhizophagus irregularis DAOM 181602=DAOM 197198]
MNKDIKHVVRSNKDPSRREKAQSILNNWKSWVNDFKKFNRDNKKLQKLISERNSILMAVQKNEIIKFTVVRDKVARTMLTRQLENFKDERPKKCMHIEQDPTIQSHQTPQPIEIIEISSDDDNSDIYSDFDDENNNKDDLEIVIEVGPDIAPTELKSKGTISVYPAEDRPTDTWVLPSGKFVADAICGPPTLHKSHPSNMGIVHLGAKNSLVEYSEYLHNIRFDTKNKQMEFAINILWWLGEFYLQTSANQRLIQRKLKLEDGNPLGLKIDRVFQSADNKPFEFGMIELSGGYNTNDFPRYLKDHVRGCWGMQNNIATKLAFGDYKNMRQLRAWFLHTHGGQDVQVWGMDIPKGLNDTVDVLENLKKSHNRNSIISKKSELKTYIYHIKQSPKKPTGKKAHNINPMKREEIKDPPSPSPMPKNESF